MYRYILNVLLLACLVSCKPNEGKDVPEIDLHHSVVLDEDKLLLGKVKYMSWENDSVLVIVDSNQDGFLHFVHLSDKKVSEYGKIGQGPGSICTTRIVAGVGIPQLTALYVCSKTARGLGVRTIADGGITKSGDMVKALTLADAMICGGLLAGCPEAPGQVMEINGKMYKQYRGMGSLSAMKAGSAARYGHDIKNKTDKITAEGVEALKEVSNSLDEALHVFVGGIQSGMGYLGAKNLEELRKNARYTRLTGAGQKESAPHDVIEIKQSGAK